MTEKDAAGAGGAEAEPQTEGAATEQTPDPRLMIHRHYIKDLSVENPNAPSIFATRQQPQIKVSLDVRAQRVVERIFEVVLAAKVEAQIEDKSAFLIELEFAALSKVGDSVPNSEMEGILGVEVPQLLFPFARNIIADVTRDAGYPPLLINPVDFSSLQRQKAEAGGNGAAEPDEA